MSKSDDIFQWLHLSDIHFSNVDNTEFNTLELQESLVEYLKDLPKGYHCMVISGDFRYAPDGVENETNIVNFIEELSEATGITKDKIIITPGNHDLTRSLFREIIAEGVQKRYKPGKGIIDSKCIKYLAEDFDFYFKLKNRIGNNYGWECVNNTPHTIVDMGECYLLLLNTALTAYGDNDEHNLIVGIQHIKKLVNRVKNVPKPIILVGHHTIDWLKQEEADACLTFFDNKHINLYLCGHQHEVNIKKLNSLVQVTIGCMKQKDKNVDAAFSIGKLCSDGTVKIDIHKWNSTFQSWGKANIPTKKKMFKKLYPIQNTEVEDKPLTTKTDYPFTIFKFKRIPPIGDDGVKYIWEKDGRHVESITFNKRLKKAQNPEDEDTSAYTISTSVGCILSAMKCQCNFCQTGMNKDFLPLTSEDIALQCIFMALYDMDCEDHPEVHDHTREFAFMGQGEPGYHYDIVKKAILLNDLAMKRLGQTVSRYIISTFGNTDFLSSLILDIKNKVFNNKISVHFSLHAIDEERNMLMPINRHYDYQEFIKLCEKYYRLTKEKIGVAILLFDKYKTINSQVEYSLTQDKLKFILEKLDKNVFRIDLCTLNETHVGSQSAIGKKKVNDLLDVVKNMGFECKLFESFDNIQIGCGMLCSSTEGAEDIGDTTINTFNDAVRLLQEVKKEYESLYLA